MEKMKRVLLKLSGEALGVNGELFDHEKINKVAAAVKDIVSTGKFQLGIVIGAGNIWRGRQGGACDMGRANADQMGMLGTAINCISMRDALQRQGVKAYVQSAVDMPRFMESYNVQAADDHLSAGHVVLFACGTGNPLLSTDTAVAVRAIELDADVILMAKNVDGVYDKDPKKHPDAKLIPDLTYQRAREENIQVMDMAAFCMCQENQFPLVRVFKLDDPKDIQKVLEGDSMGSFVHP